jgi:amino acid transporter
LSYDSHNIILYAKGQAGNTGSSEAIAFRIGGSFSTLIAAIIAWVALIGIASVSYYAKKAKNGKSARVITILLYQRVTNTT